MKLSVYSLIGHYQVHSSQRQPARKDANEDKKSDIPHSTDKESVSHSEETNMNKHEGYNEVREDETINPNEEQKRKAKRGK